jgi:hypothetical protein
MFTSLAVFFLVFFRWVLFQRFLGAKRMHLFDAIMWTAIAAFNFSAIKLAALDGWGVVNLLMTGLCLFWAYGAGKRFLNYDELVKAANNEQGKSGTGTASGS